MSTLPVEPAWKLSGRAPESRWLVTGLWSCEAVGIVGGEPKCCKSFLALDLAVAVASGAPALRRFPVVCPGRVLLYAAEDALHIVRARLEGICAAADCRLQDLDIQVITAASVRLDLPADRDALERTVADLKPKLLILDPFVRLHRIDENSSGEVAPLLAYLRELQRRHALAVLLVHHAKKTSGHIRAGQALRGSSEFHAWGDSNLYLRRELSGQLTLTVEHRAAPSPPSLPLDLQQHGPALALAVVAPPQLTSHRTAPSISSSPARLRAPIGRCRSQNSARSVASAMPPCTSGLQSSPAPVISCATPTATASRVSTQQKCKIASSAFPIGANAPQGPQPRSLRAAASRAGSRRRFLTDRRPSPDPQHVKRYSLNRTVATGATPPTPFPFPVSLQRVGTGTGNALK